jgi:hypothetical protein
MTDAPGSQFHHATFRTYIFELLTPSKNMSPSLSFAVRLNNTAAELVLHSRRYEEAVEMFTRSLKIVKVQLRKRRVGYHDTLIIASESNIDTPFSPSGSASKHTTIKEQKPPALKTRHPANACSKAPPPKVQKGEPNETQGYMFSEPIIVDENDLNSQNEEDILRFTMFLIFNLALSQHLRALEFKTISRSAFRTTLKKSLALYSLLYKMQMKKDSGSGLSYIHTMALINNLAQIHAVNEDAEKSRECLGYLLNYLVFYTEVGGNCTDEMDGFRTNITPLILTDPALALAA